MSVPDAVREVLEPFVEDLKAREVIFGIGLFGSWGRGDATSGSDVDLLIVESRDFDYEYTERIELENNLFVDLNYVPKQWIAYRVPPELDQKLYELQILFDRDNSLTRAKNLISKIYWKPERVDIRTEAHLVEADAYLSRARLALNKGDYRSVKVNSIRGFRSLMKILTEISKNLILNSSFVGNLESLSKSLGMQSLYDDYIDLMGLFDVDEANAQSMLNSLSSAWKEMINFIESNLPLAGNLHPSVRAKLKYYGRESFLKGLVARVSSLIEESEPAEPAHYMFHTLASMLENYAFLVSVVDGVRFDYAAILKYLSESKSSPTKVYEESINVLGVREVSNQEAEETLKIVTESAKTIRQKRKDLISRFIG